MRRLHVGAAAMGALGALALPSTAVGAPANNDGRYVAVANNNLENLAEPGYSGSDKTGTPCSGDWRALTRYLGRYYVPDIFTVQQLSPVPTGDGQGMTQVQRFERALESATKQSYGYVLSQRRPARFRGAGCDPHKDYQANAIFYRSSRFSLASRPRTGESKAWNGSKCVPASAAHDGAGAVSRTLSVYARFKDHAPGAQARYLTVQSIHWPSGNQDPGSRCAPENARDSALRSSSSSGDGLRIFGGDTNTLDVDSNGPRQWWLNLNKCSPPLGPDRYCDIIDGVCRYFSGNYSACKNQNGTSESDGSPKRRDYIFAQRGDGRNPGVIAAKTLPYAEVNGSGPRHYSQHRAVAAVLAY